MRKTKGIYLTTLLIIAILTITGCQIFSPPTQIVTPSPSNQTQPTNPPNIDTFEINPSEIMIGQPATLTWKVTNATEIDLSPDMGYIPATGTKAVSPTERTVYTIKATNSAGSKSKSVTITINKNIRAVQMGLTEEDTKPKGFVFDSNTEPKAEGCGSTYRVTFTRGQATLENTIYIYDSKTFMKKVFDEDRINSRVYVSNPLVLIGDEGYLLTIKTGDPNFPDTYALKFIKNNVYVKLIGNIPWADLENYARIVESRIR